MLKKLKIRLILHNMRILSVVFAILFVAFCFFLYIQEETKITNTLKDKNDSAAIFFESGIHRPSADDMPFDISFSVLVSPHSNVIKTTETELDEQYIKSAVNYALKSEYERGTVSEMKISFLRKQTPSGTVISFISREYIEDKMSENITRTIIAGIISLFVFAFINYRFASMALAPVEKAWEQQKQFLADASHDLKTPLTVILANNNIISSHKDQTVESQMKWIDSTTEEATRMTELVNKMLELAKSEATKDELKIGEVNLSELVENSILQFEVVAFERNLSIESGIQPNIIARTHPSTFSKVLEILFDNAIKYSEENGKITVTLYQSGKKIFFSINNKGEYINPEDLPHIFERFYRTNKERDIGGHGLGLSIAKKKCDMIGCKLSVESNEYDGTTFTITCKASRK